MRPPGTPLASMTVDRRLMWRLRQGVWSPCTRNRILPHRLGPTATAEEDPGAPFMNETPKYVVSSKLQSTEWQNSSVLGSYDPEAIQSLKDRIEAGIYVSGSAQLVRSMLADGLVDELHLFVYP